jgi:CheY-like chemotaxis protein
MTTALVVDDSAMDRRLIGGLLKRAGYEVLYAENGRHALELLAEKLPDIVATDLQMPELDGLELVAAIRQQFPSVPVLLMTAHGSEEIAVKALQKGAASYVPKRSLAKDLVVTIQNILEVTQADHPEQRVLDWMVHTESLFVLDNDVSVIPPLVSHLEASLTRMKIVDQTALIQVGVALREAIVNAMYHGNLEVSSSLREEPDNAFFDLVEERRRTSPYQLRRVRVTARETRAEVTYVVTDEGPGFDPSALPDPTDPQQLESVSGRGLLLIRTFMDEVLHNPQGNEITMIKRLDRLSSDFAEQ